MIAANQLDAFLSNVPSQLSGITLPPGTPKTVFPSALQLTLEEEERLMLHCKTQINQLEVTNGRNIVNQPDWWRGSGISTDNKEQDPMATFFGRREKWDMIYAMQLEWRAFTDPIWAESNIHIPFTHRIVRQQIARAQQYFFGTDPWYTVSPAGTDDDETARLIDHWTKWAFRKAKVKEILQQAIQFAFIRGEAIVKSTWKAEADYYKTYAEVAIDIDGRPLVAEDGDYIYPEDEWIYDETGELRVLRRSPETGLPDWAEGDEANLEFDTLLIDKEKARYKGVDLSIPAYKDILISPRATDIASAPFIAHLYTRPAIDVAGEYIEHLRRSQHEENIPKIIEMLRGQGSGRSRDWTAQLAPRADLGESTYSMGQTSGIVSTENSILPTEPSMDLAECYLWFDVHGTGRPQDIVVLMDKANDRPIFYDFIQNYAPARPFHVVRVNPVDNRWHGQSAVEDCWQLNSNIDLQFNRINISNKRSGFFYELDPDVYRDFEGQSNPVGVALNGGHVYTRKQNMVGREGFKATPLVEIKGDSLFSMIEFLNQVLTNMSATSSANDAQAAGLDTSNLATGIRHLERSNQEQFAPFLAQLTEGIESATRACIELCMSNMDPEETFRFLDGDAMRTAIVQKTKIKDFGFDLRLEISRFRAEAQSQQTMAAMVLIKDYAAQMPEVKMAMRGLATRQLKLYEVPNPEALLDVLDQAMPVAPSGAPMAAQAPVTSPEIAVAPSV